MHPEQRLISISWDVHSFCLNLSNVTTVNLELWAYWWAFVAVYCCVCQEMTGKPESQHQMCGRESNDADSY